MSPLANGGREGRFRAVIFDLGGVVFPSPFTAFAAHERERGLPEGFIRRVVATNGEHSAWACLERGEIDFSDFCRQFDAECERAGGRIDSAHLMALVRGRTTRPVPEMERAIGAIRARGMKTAALTNNWLSDRRESDPNPPHRLFDVVVESSRTGLRKPDPRIYRLVCDQLHVEPPETVFLDDLGMNLKPARALGMTTIKVVEADDALAELERVLGFSLRS